MCQRSVGNSYSLLGTRFSLLATRYSRFGVRDSGLAIRHSLFAAPCSLPHRSPKPESRIPILSAIEFSPSHKHFHIRLVGCYAKRRTRHGVPRNILKDKVLI